MISQTTTKQFENILNLFLIFCKKELNIKSLPIIYLIKDVRFSVKLGAFGETNRSNRILIYIKNRQPMDILRTVAHELVHYKQHELGRYGSGMAGSYTENQANAKAGVIIRNFGKMHSEIFGLPPVK